VEANLHMILSGRYGCAKRGSRMDNDLPRMWKFGGRLKFCKFAGGKRQILWGNRM
jgi:hypothetical protein